MIAGVLPAEFLPAGGLAGAARLAERWSLALRPTAPDLPRADDGEIVCSDPDTGYIVRRPLGVCWDYVVQHGEVAHSAVDIAGRSAVVVPSRPGIPDSSLWHVWLDQLLPAILDIEGLLALHAGAVDLGGAGVLFLGSSGAGKSTLTASLASSGTPALSDDGVVVTGSEAGFTVEPIYPGLRLLPDSRAMLVPEDVPTSDVSHFALKKRIHLTEGLSGSPTPLAAIFLLGSPGGVGEVQVARLAPARACMKLIEHSFALDPTDVTRGAARLKQAAALAAAVPAFSLTYPRDYDRLPEVHAALSATVAGLAERPVPA